MLRAKQGIIRNAPTSPALDSNHPLPHPFDEQFRTSAASVFAAGDVLGPTLASIAMEQGRAAACHAMALQQKVIELNSLLMRRVIMLMSSQK